MNETKHHVPILTLLLLAASMAAAPAGAEAPSETGWSPASYPGTPLDLDLSHTGGFLALGTADPVENDAADTDLHFLNLTDGPMGSQADESFLQHEGTHHVAVSPDGTVAVAGVEEPAGDAGTGTSEPNLYYIERDSVPTSSWSKRLSQPVTAVDVSSDGAYVLATTSTSSNGHAYLYDRDGNLVKEFTLDGTLGTAVLADDGGWFAVGGEADTDAGRRAHVEVHSRSGGTGAAATWTDDGDLPTEVLSLAITPDGRYLAAGTSNGLVLSFANDDGTVSGPTATELGGNRAATLAIAADGHAVAAGATDGLHYLTRVGDGTTLQLDWSHATSNPVADLDMTLDGSYVVSAVDGADGAALAHHAQRATPIWSLPGARTLAAVTGGADHALFASPTGNVTAVAFHRDLVAGFLGEDGNLTTEAPGRPNLSTHETGSFTLLVSNRGSAQDVVEFSTTTTTAWSIDANRTRIDILPGETARVRVDITPESASAGEHDVPVVFRSTKEDGVSTQIELPVHVETTSGISVRLAASPETRAVSAGETVQANFILENLGNSRVEPTVSVRQDPSRGGDWPVDAPQRLQPLGPGDTTTIPVEVQVPSGTEPGTRNTLVVSVDTGSATASAAVGYLADPFLGVEVSTDTTARHVNATIPGWFNITVTNTGSVDTSYVFVHEKTPHGTQGWVVDRPLDPFRVGTGSSSTIPVLVRAPANGVVGDKVNVKLQVIPEIMGGQVTPDVQDNVTVSAIFYDFPEEDKDFWQKMHEQRRDAPGFDVLLLVVAGLAAAALRTRRRW